MILEYDFNFLDEVRHSPSGVQGRVTGCYCNRDGIKEIEVTWYDDKTERQERYRHDECELIVAAESR